MHAFVVLGLVFFIPSQEIGLGKCLRDDLFSVEWDVKPRLNQGSIGGWREDEVRPGHCFMLVL